MVVVACPLSFCLPSHLTVNPPRPPPCAPPSHGAARKAGRYTTARPGVLARRQLWCCACPPPRMRGARGGSAGKAGKADKRRTDLQFLLSQVQLGDQTVLHPAGGRLPASPRCRKVGLAAPQRPRSAPAWALAPNTDRMSADHAAPRQCCLSADRCPLSPRPVPQHRSVFARSPFYFILNFSAPACWSSRLPASPPNCPACCRPSHSPEPTNCPQCCAGSSRCHRRLGLPVLTLA